MNILVTKFLHGPLDEVAHFYQGPISLYTNAPTTHVLPQKGLRTLFLLRNRLIKKRSFDLFYFCLYREYFPIVVTGSWNNDL